MPLLHSYPTPCISLSHEVMNLQGDLRYVTEDEIATFGGPEARKAAWDMQTGWLGSFVYNSFNISHIQNGHTMFSHADMSIEWATKGVDQMNFMAHQALGEKLFKEPIFKTYGRSYFEKNRQASSRGSIFFPNVYEQGF